VVMTANSDEATGTLEADADIRLILREADGR